MPTGLYNNNIMSKSKCSKNFNSQAEIVFNNDPY